MSPMHDVHHISVYIARRPTEVYAFASDPRNLPRWAAGLARSEVRKDGDEWVADAPFGKVKVRFAPQNSFGVMDHDVKLESGITVHNLMRVMPNVEGSGAAQDGGRYGVSLRHRGHSEHLLNDIDLRALGYECAQHVAGERAIHVFLRKHA